MELLGYAASIIIGLTLGMLGGGGSILAIPILVFLFQLDPVIATAYSLFIVGVTSMFGILTRRGAAMANLNVGMLFGIPSLITIFVTRKWIVPSIPNILISLDNFDLTKRLFLLGLFAVLMILTSISMLSASKETTPRSEHPRTVLLILLGIPVGLLIGLVGAGGGFLIIPSLIFLAGLSMKEATSTSLFIIGFNSLIGFTGDVLNFSIEWSFLLGITVVAIAGIIIGNQLVRFIQGYHLRISFGWFTLIMGTSILLRELFLT